jgi:copper homeostasis protein
MNTSFTLEVCVDSVESALAAQRGGAHRVELCGALADGGITPSAGLIAMVREKINIALHVMVRPRNSDFYYSEDEFKVMQSDVETAKKLGADGVVFGILDANGRVDTRRTKQLLQLASPLNVTFHRAFDMSRDLRQSLDDLRETGVHRVLTSGGKQTALQGAATLKELVDAPGNNLVIMAASGIEEQNVAELLARTGVREVHASLRATVPSLMRYHNARVSMGTTQSKEYERLVVDEEKVRKLLLAVSNRQSESSLHR